ncbi:hypothetical protein VaNZ11_005478 [Volvox africanus]|uniref:Retrotransposon gag domain-containing protein n=1 Tax=Volvox africanus TaxID=51714 RepID=A0ABQ5RZ99_9CHLO|nr:hypothetical protein VaNZ11_005478 [Volvox africanus]
MAKALYDQWITARENFTFDELTATLLARFTPEAQSRDIEARCMLAFGSFFMFPNETVTAYQSRFEVLVISIPDFSEMDCIYWFQQGLSESVTRQCVTDLIGTRVQSYVELMPFVLRAEMRILARQNALRLVPHVTAMQTQDP